MSGFCLDLCEDVEHPFFSLTDLANICNWCLTPGPAEPAPAVHLYTSETSKAAVLNLWAADLFLVGRDQGWELRIFLCESRVTIHEKVPSLSSGVRASATYLNDFWEY